MKRHQGAGLILWLLSLWVTVPAYGQSQTPLAHISSDSGAPKGHGRTLFLDGHMIIVYSEDSGKGGGGIAIYRINGDMTPTHVRTIDNPETQALREAHGFSVFKLGKRVFAAFQAIEGLQIWDFTDVLNPKMISYLRLPGSAPSDYTHGIWWITAQYPYLFAGGSSNGLYVINAKDPWEPLLEVLPRNPIPPEELGGFRVGPIFAQGDRLVYSSMDEPGLGVLKIENLPTISLLHAERSAQTPNAYSTLLHGDLMVSAGNDNQVHIHRIAEPIGFEWLASSPLGGKGGYLSIVGPYLHVGASSEYDLFDIANPERPSRLLTIPRLQDELDWDFATGFGSHVLVSDDHGYGSYLFQVLPGLDKTPPELVLQTPSTGLLHPASGIALTISEEIDFHALDESKIELVDDSGKSVPYFLSYQMGILNLKARSPLKEGRTYTLSVQPAAFKDIAGNVLRKPGTFVFKSVLDPGSRSCTISGPATFNVKDGATFRVSTSATDALQSVAWYLDDQNLNQGGDTLALELDHGGQSLLRAELETDLGRIACHRSITAFLPPTPTAPLRTRTLAADLERRLLLNLNPDHDSLSVFELDGLKKLREIALGSKPKSIALDREHAYVANYLSAEISVISLQNLQLIRTISLPYGSLPYGTIFNQADGRLYVSLYGKGQLARIGDPSGSHPKIDYLPVGPRIGTMALESDTKSLWISQFMLHGDESRLYEVSLESFSLTNSLALHADEASIDAEDKGRGVANYLGMMAISPSGDRLLIPAKKDNVFRGLKRDGKALNFESTVRAITREIDLSTGMERIERETDYNDRALPSAVEFNPQGDRYFIAFLGTPLVEVRSAFDHRLIDSLDQAGAGNLDILSVEDKVFVANFLERSLSVYKAEETRYRTLAQLSSVDSELLPANVLAGKKMFYDAADLRMSRDGYLSCASCHIDGHEDGVNWDFTDRGEGLRNTISLLGKQGMAHGRVHWTGNFDEIQDFESDIRTPFGGQGFLSHEHDATAAAPLAGKKRGLSPELDALSAYLTSLDAFLPSSYRKADGSMSAEALKGQAVFNRLACAECHSAANFTDSAVDQDRRRDIGTIVENSGMRLGSPLDGFDIPTLFGLADTAPYLHLGDRNKLADVFQTAAGSSGAHRIAENLGEAELSDLVRYLQELAPQSADSAKSAPLILDIQVRGKPVTLGRIHPEGLVYSDRAYRFTAIPPALSGLTFLQTANDDKKLQSADYLRIKLARKARIYVLFDQRASNFPGWLASFRETGEQVATSDVTLRVFSKDVDAGELILGGNAVPPMEGAGSNYSLVITEIAAF